MNNEKLIEMIYTILKNQQEINEEIKRLLLIKPMSNSDVETLTRQLKVNSSHISVLKDNLLN